MDPVPFWTYYNYITLHHYQSTLNAYVNKIYTRTGKRITVFDTKKKIERNDISHLKYYIMIRND